MLTHRASFCNDSKRPAVSGRFGPVDSGCWRHEYSVEPEDNLDNVENHFWSLFAPWMVTPGPRFSPTLKKAVEFPRDCIKVVRCRPFTYVVPPNICQSTTDANPLSRFAVKVVNRWFSQNTMLIGDAAHVFPPFGGQGIATGIRDAQALGWRLAIMSRVNMSNETRQRILTGWGQERRHAWQAALMATKLNGSIVNQRSIIGGFFYRVWMRLLWQFKRIARYRTQNAFRDKLIYTHETCPDGFFLGQAGGGRKVAQIWVRKEGQEPKLSDAAFLRCLSHLSLLVLVGDDAHSGLRDEVAAALKESDLQADLLTMDGVSFYQKSGSRSQGAEVGSLDCYHPCTAGQLAGEGITPLKGYRHTSLQDRFGPTTRFVLVRPDFFVHSVASDVGGLLENLRKVKEYFS